MLFKFSCLWVRIKETKYHFYVGCEKTLAKGGVSECGHALRVRGTPLNYGIAKG